MYPSERRQSFVSKGTRKQCLVSPTHICKIPVGYRYLFSLLDLPGGVQEFQAPVLTWQPWKDGEVIGIRLATVVDEGEVRADGPGRTAVSGGLRQGYECQQMDY